MPELPEVQTVVTTLEPRVTGRRIDAIQLFRTDIVSPESTDLAACILGRRIATISRRGKRIVFTLDDDNCFYIHLGMTGQLTAEPADREVKKHTHLILTLGPTQDAKKPASARAAGVSPASSFQLRFRDPRRFGGIFWLGCNNVGDENMGPEPLGMSPVDLAGALAKTSRPIKSALLDQRVVAGLGNIYVDESLFAAGIHPLTICRRLKPDQVARLTTEIKRILKIAIRARGSTLRDYVDGNGQLGTAQNLHAVYAREGRPCPTCGTKINRIILAGRSTHFCPKCQRRRW